MIVCHCAVVSDRQVRAVIEAGVTSLGNLCRQTGAGRDCGGCVLAVRQVLSKHVCPPAVAEPAVPLAAAV